MSIFIAFVEKCNFVKSYKTRTSTSISIEDITDSEMDKTNYRKYAFWLEESSPKICNICLEFMFPKLVGPTAIWN